MIAGGGALGALARHGTTVMCGQMFGNRFPLGTLVVNVVGCFALGWLVRAVGSWEAWGDSTRLGVGTGFLGALTTFSTFGVQTVQLWSKSPALALLNVTGNLVLGLVAASLGMYLAIQMTSAAKW
jgi:CrcB protein